MGTWEIVPSPEDDISPDLTQGGADVTRLLHAATPAGASRAEMAVGLAHAITTIAFQYVGEGAPLSEIAFLAAHTTDGSDPLFAIVEQSLADMFNKLNRALAD